MKEKNVLDFVKSEMKPSMGCTEPVAIGLAVSNTCQYLQKAATKIKLKLSSNIFKNAYCVKIPNTKEAGIPLAAALGYLLTKQGNTMEIFSGVNDDLVGKAHRLLCDGLIEIEAIHDNRFYIEVNAKNDDEDVTTITLDKHDNLVKVVKNGKIIIDNEIENEDCPQGNFDISNYTVKELIDFAEKVDLSSILFLREARDMNVAVSNEGLKKPYGLGIGKNIKEMVEKGILPNDLMYYVKSVVAAAADCRMGGGSYPAMTVMGSGNQGFQTTLPVIATADFLKLDEEKCLRGMLISILMTARQKEKVGRLSPVCGAFLAGASASAAITWLLGGNYAQIEGARKNIYASIAGMMCDGAKDGCAMKLATCAGEAVIAARLSMNGSVATKTDGIVSETIEETIDNISVLSKVGMGGVDMNVIEILMNKGNNQK
ncbi:MAG: L-serine ammonia-lyase, iron-sulfur-dependent, subunit alpha [Oscillospiraceae bacterium]